MHNFSINRYSLFILRITLSGIFIIAAINHIFFTEKVATRLESSALTDMVFSLGSADTLVMLSGIFMFLGGISLLVGFKTRLAAIGLLLILLPITLTVQVGQWATAGPLFKNIVIMGGLLFFALNGCLCYGMDQIQFLKQGSKL